MLELEPLIYHLCIYYIYKACTYSDHVKLRPNEIGILTLLSSSTTLKSIPFPKAAVIIRAVNTLIVDDVLSLDHHNTVQPSPLCTIVLVDKNMHQSKPGSHATNLHGATSMRLSNV